MNNVLQIIVFVLQNIKPEHLVMGDMLQDPPLAKSFGFAIKKSLEKTLDDARLNKEYMYRYHEMLKSSQESLEGFARGDERKLRSVIGIHNYEVMRDGLCYLVLGIHIFSS